jgi:hexosaminidase
MPGHSLAALAAYPEFSCTGGPFEVPIRFGVKKDVYCAGKDAVFGFLQDVLDEVLELFPSDIIHIGGDEVPKSRWKKCPDCQVRIRAEGIQDEFALQAYFMNRMASFLVSRDRKAMGWNEILHDDLQEGVIGQYWWGNRSAVYKHLRNGRNIVMSPSPRLYLDFDYVVSSLRHVYTYEPVPRDLEPAFRGNIIGVETPLWTEWVRDVKRIHHLTFPRLMAVAEIGWTPPENKNFKEFKTCLARFLQRLDLHHIGYTRISKTETSPFRHAIFFWHMANESKDKEFE